VLGAFFKSTSIRREDKELVMVVTPHVVQPLARETKLPRLPGAKYDRYDPNFAQTLLFESGDFDIGFGR
jgi:pilus assembly protein CpaC